MSAAMKRAVLGGVTSIEHGTEVFIGNGRLDVDSYTADIR